MLRNQTHFRLKPTPECPVFFLSSVWPTESRDLVLGTAVEVVPAVLHQLDVEASSSVRAFRQLCFMALKTACAASQSTRLDRTASLSVLCWDAYSNF